MKDVKSARCCRPSDLQLMTHTIISRGFLLLCAVATVFFLFWRPPSSLDNLRKGSCAPSFAREILDLTRLSVLGLLHRTLERSVRPYIGNYTEPEPLQVARRVAGQDWPVYGITMVGESRLRNIEFALRTVTSEGVDGDYMECGVWRGGASIYAAMVLRVLGDSSRRVWLVDSFKGLPAARSSEDDNTWSKMTYLMVPLAEVKENIRSYGLLDEKIQFCEGYFVDSLPRCSIQNISVLRMDGDMYDSTMDQLFNLYAKVSIGGFVIVDDWLIPPCKRAINDFRRWHGIVDPIVDIDATAMYWRKRAFVEVQTWRYRVGSNLAVPSVPVEK